MTDKSIIRMFGMQVSVLWHLLVLLTIFFSPTISASPVKVGLFKWEPLITEDISSRGVMADAALTILTEQGYDVEAKVYPFARLLVELKDERIDVALGVSKTKERTQDLSYSQTYYELEMGFMFKNTSPSYKSITDLVGLNGGILRNSFWKEVLSQSNVTFEETSTQEQNIRKLISERLDFVCLPKEVGQYYLVKYGEDLKDYTFLTHHIENQYLAISKKSTFPNLIQNINAGIQKEFRRNSHN